MIAAITDLLTRYGDVEICQLADDTNLVTPTLLRAALANEDLSDYSEEAQAAVAVAIERLNARLLDATARIEALLEGRYTLPITPVPARLVDCGCVLTRYLLDRNPPEAMIRRWKEECQWLETAPLLGLTTSGQTTSATIVRPVDVASPWGCRDDY